MEASSIPRQSLLAQMAEGVCTTVAGETAVATGQEELHHRRRRYRSGLERPRGSWLLGKVLQTFPDWQGLVQSVKVRTKYNILERPITKICLLLEAD